MSIAGKEFFKLQNILLQIASAQINGSFSVFLKKDKVKSFFTLNKINNGVFMDNIDMQEVVAAATKDELKKLKDEIEAEMCKRDRSVFFRESIDHLKKLKEKELEAQKARRLFEATNPQLKAIGELGFSIVIHDHSDNMVSLMNYTKSKDLVEKSLYGCKYSLKNGFEFDEWTEKPTDKELEELSTIINSNEER